MPPILRPILISLCAYLLFNSWLIVSYPEPIVNTSPVRHVEKVIIKPIIYDRQSTFTAYTLSEDETDSTPCIGAGNHNLCEYKERVCATRLFPLHTKLNIEGIGQCEVLDRTSVKYARRIDILMDTKEEAIQFGKKELKYKLLTPSGK